MTDREQTHKDLIQLVARKLGNHHRPATYIEYIDKTYDIQVSSSSTTKALGSLYSRLRADEPKAVETGKKLLEMCYYDKGLASYVLNKAVLA
jgi:hypothetical protein